VHFKFGFVLLLGCIGEPRNEVSLSLMMSLSKHDFAAERALRQAQGERRRHVFNTAIDEGEYGQEPALIRRTFERTVGIVFR
jgi:hypothetical protein